MGRAFAGFKRPLTFPRLGRRRGGGGPVNLVAPSIIVLPAVAAVVGETVRGDVGVWLGDLTGYTYRWLLDGVEVGTSDTYTMTAPGALVFEVTATSSQGSAVVSSPVVTVSAVVIPSAITATFGAKTLAGAGAYRPVDNAGNPLDLASYDSLVSGSLGSYTPSISGGGLRFTGGGAGAPAGAVLRCTYAAGGTVDITIGALEANAFSAATMAEVGSAYSSATAALGNTCRLRAGTHNPTAVRFVWSRSTVLPGTWTGTSALSDGNWFVVTRDLASKVTIGAVEIGGNGNTHPRYLRMHDLDFAAPFNANASGIGTGVSLNTNGIVNLNATGGGYVALTNCRLRHVDAVTGRTSGTFRAINSGQGSTVGPFWIEGNSIDGARHGVIGSNMAGVVRKNIFKRVLSDVAQIGHCQGLIFEGNVATEKIYGFTPQTITAIARGATTVVTMADTTQATVNEPMVFTGVSGALGEALNGRQYNISAKTATTITVAVNTSALPDWDGVSGTAILASAVHGDYLQFNENLGATETQSNVSVRANQFYRGFVDGGLLPGGQFMFAGTIGTTAPRRNWVVEGNVFVDCFVNGISIGNLTDSMVRSNTVVRALGVDASTGSAVPSIRILSGSSGNTLRDNIATAYEIVGGTTIEETGNVTLTIVNDGDVPADPANVTAYKAAFSAPVTVPNVAYSAKDAFATRTDPGSVYPGPIYPGATPYMDFDTLVYSDPRP